MVGVPWAMDVGRTLPSLFFTAGGEREGIKAGRPSLSPFHRWDTALER